MCIPLWMLSSGMCDVFVVLEAVLEAMQPSGKLSYALVNIALEAASLPVALQWLL
jgi:hypothetical protein